MSGIGVKHSPELSDPEVLDPVVIEQRELAAARERQAERMRLLWDHRQLLLKSAGVGLLLFTLVAFLIPNSYTSIAQLMPPDGQSSSALAMMSALVGKSGAGFRVGEAGEIFFREDRFGESEAGVHGRQDAELSGWAAIFHGALQLFES